MRIHIAKVDEVLFSEEADGLTAPAGEGEVTILPNHIPLVSALKAGRVRVHKGGNTQYAHFDIDGGMLEVTQESATILL